MGWLLGDTTPETALVYGLLLVILSVPALISAWSDRRRPYVGTLLLFAGCALAVWAWRVTPGGFAVSDLPDVIYGFIGDVMH